MNEDRQAIWEEYQGEKNEQMRRMFLDYDRYFEVNKIIEALGFLPNQYEDFSVLDYGCGVADYGLTLAKKGATVALIDSDDPTLAFAKWRFAREDIDLFTPERKFDLVIFGEVLEHLDSPYDVINQYVAEGTKYIFTSSYPFRTDNPDDAYWQHDHHSKKALQQQPAVRELLLNHYKRVMLGGERSLWIKK